MVKHIQIDGHDVASWAAVRSKATGRKHCSKCVMGRLLAALAPMMKKGAGAGPKNNLTSQRLASLISAEINR